MHDINQTRRNHGMPFGRKTVQDNCIFFLTIAKPTSKLCGKTLKDWKLTVDKTRHYKGDFTSISAFFFAVW